MRERQRKQEKIEREREKVRERERKREIEREKEREKHREEKGGPIKEDHTHTSLIIHSPNELRRALPPLNLKK